MLEILIMGQIIFEQIDPEMVTSAIDNMQQNDLTNTMIKCHTIYCFQQLIQFQ